MDHRLRELAALLRERNAVAARITGVIRRPCQIGHIGEFIASLVFGIELETSAAHRAYDGRFRGGSLSGRTVNIKFYAKRESLLDIRRDAVPDYYLVLAGPKATSTTSVDEPRLWFVDHVFLFHGASLVRRLQERRVKIGVATSIVADEWEAAEIYPSSNNPACAITDDQRATLRLFGSPALAPQVAVAAVAERDLDLLLLEELTSSPEFASWLAGRVSTTLHGGVKVLHTARSVTLSQGESDLEVLLETATVRVCLMIENKIGAAFQPRQGERYHERGEIHVESKHCDMYWTVLVAPERYLQPESPDHAGFDAQVTYEEIRDWVVRNVPGARGAYKVAMLDAAIEKSTRGYQPVEDAAVTAFWTEYWNIACKVAPELEMRQPTSRPAGSTFVYFRPGGMPRGVSIVHKMTHGNLDLQFMGRADDLISLRDTFASRLMDGMSIRKAGRSGVIRRRVPAIDPGRDMGSQRETVRECLLRAVELLRWYDARDA